MKYIEELQNGETFVFDKENFVITSDFKANGNRLAYSLKNGHPKWMNSDCSVKIEPIYVLDEQQNISPVFEYKKDENID